ncbi:fatty acid-binding protein DegV [Secundilactobacillus paracollinoides]|uniref:Fatty acid-binding protein DegV n=1 Tax=Secundilactobacillus paracollinoides TaxID=240427 RepID=A0A1B2J196_9LACO|nr:DegV family protein [Secundilactobacillus paracollinoides]ANZ62075.1 fatty acid-binding protein DegV [Secundilactobacillus paracollinoides]ANZ63759.1 fatty acid-binding protein DegV [Secundilactobacillus paracollinoides]ANZ68020.1 fatty acid-binding protein DegV [Secundilactobacillus paracollinoides]
MKIAVVTDSTSYLSTEEVERYHIHVVPIPVVIDGRSYNEGVDITLDEFWEKLRNSKSFPSTSQPPMGEMIQLYQQLGDEGYDTIISIHLASTISGFVNSLRDVNSQLTNTKVIVYDSQITVKLMGYLAIEAARMADKGADADQIIARLDDVRSTIDEVFIVDDLQHLVRGGRLSNASAFIGSILKIKPLLTFDDETHEIVAFEKVRSRKKALTRVEEIFSEAVSKVDYPLRAIVINGNDPDGGNNWLKTIHEKFPQVKIETGYFGPVIGTHLGEKSLALAWLKDIYKA